MSPANTHTDQNSMRRLKTRRRYRRYTISNPEKTGIRHYAITKVMELPPLITAVMEVILLSCAQYSRNSRINRSSQLNSLSTEITAAARPASVVGKFTKWLPAHCFCAQVSTPIESLADFYLARVTRIFQRTHPLALSLSHSLSQSYSLTQSHSITLHSISLTRSISLNHSSLNLTHSLNLTQSLFAQSHLLAH